MDLELAQILPAELGLQAQLAEEAAEELRALPAKRPLLIQDPEAEAVALRQVDNQELEAALEHLSPHSFKVLWAHTHFLSASAASRELLVLQVSRAARELTDLF